MNSPDNQTDNSLRAYVLATIFIVFVIVVFTVYIIIVRWDSANAPPAHSYQEKNLEVLKAAQPNDLVICVGEKPGGSHIKFAFLVEQNMGTYMTGHYPSQRTLSRADGGESFVLLSTWECEMQILRPSETRVASDMLASIILYGFKYAPPK
ncbi:MAG: hypothetical protein WAU28_00395 [Candidatus Moraniibacteriota bacterium]